MSIFHRKLTEYPFMDMHCHILPGIDDGSRSIEETQKMLAIAAKEGCTDIIATPHFKLGSKNAPPDRIRQMVREINEIAADYGITLYPGNEIYYCEEIEELLNENKVLTLNDTDQVLVEFSPMDPYARIQNGLTHILEIGYTPVLAHIERYSCMVGQIGDAERLFDLGVRIQINAGDLLGELGAPVRKYLEQLLKLEFVDFIGTDAHRGEHHTKHRGLPPREPRMKECLNRLYGSKDYHPEYIECISCENIRELL